MVLVSILGDFHSSILPVYNEMAEKLTKHIIIYDDAKADVQDAKNIISGIKKFNKKYNYEIKILTHCIDEDSIEALYKCVDFIKQNTTKLENTFINTTDGLSNINTILSKKLLKNGAHFVSYDRYDNEVNIITNDNMQKYTIKNNISVQDHFLLRNIKVDKLENKKFAKNNKDKIIRLFEKHLTEYQSFSQYVLKTPIPKYINKYKNINKIIQQLNIKEKKLKASQQFITGGLFEYYVYLKMLNYDIDDIEIGVVVNQNLNEIHFVPNEFDILFMKDNHLHMIECKFSQKVNRDALVYKYMGLKGLLDDDGKVCMITMHDNPKDIMVDKVASHFHQYKRAKANNMLLLGSPFENINQYFGNLAKFFEIAKENY